jgi:hypothetical protein
MEMPWWFLIKSVSQITSESAKEYHQTCRRFADGSESEEAAEQA